MSITPQNTQPIISLKKMANMLGISTDALRKRCLRNQIPSHKYCGKWVFILGEVIDDIQKQKKEPTSVYVGSQETDDLDILRRGY